MVPIRVRTKVEANLGTYTGKYRPDNAPVTDLENKALRNATIALIIYVLIMGLLMFPANALFRSPEPDGVLTLKAFLHDGLIPAILLLFLIPGAAYGWTTGKLRTSHAVSYTHLPIKSSGSCLLNFLLIYVFILVSV